MPERMPVEIHLDPVNAGRGKIVLGGLDISRAVRAVLFKSEVGDATRVSLELIATPVKLVGNADVVLGAPEPPYGAYAVRPVSERLLELLAAIHKELIGEAETTEEPKDA